MTLEYFDIDWKCPACFKMLCCYAIGSLKDVLTCVKTNSNYFLYSFSLLQRTICASGSCQQHFVCKTTGHSAHTQHVTSTMINWLNTHPTLAWNEWIHEPFLFTMLLGSSQNEVTRWSGGKPLSVYPLSGPLSIYLSIPVWPLKGGETGIQVFQFHFLLEHLVLLGPGAHLKRPWMSRIFWL